MEKVNLKVFNFQDHTVRTVNQDGETWFVAKDICDCLELTDVSMSLTRLRDSEKLIQKLFVSGQDRDVWLVNEPGLYRLIFTSNKPEAQAFQDWVYHDVLPAIRKKGVYADTEQKLTKLTPEEIHANLLALGKEMQKKFPQLEITGV